MPVCQLRSTDSKHVPRGSPAKWLAAATNWQSAEESGRLSLNSWRQSRRFSLLIKKKCLMPWLMNLTSLLISVNYIIEKWRVRTFRKWNPLTNMRILLRQQLYRNHQAPLFPINLSTKKTVFMLAEPVILVAAIVGFVLCLRKDRKGIWNQASAPPKTLRLYVIHSKMYNRKKSVSDCIQLP